MKQTTVTLKNKRAMQVSDELFESIIGEAMDRLPELYAKRMNNVGITWEYEPSAEQRQKLKLHCNQTLFGLYEGIPLTQRRSNYNLVLPDKITIFKNPLCASVQNIAQLKKQVYHTLWHEVAHHFGLNHKRIHELEEESSE